MDAASVVRIQTFRVQRIANRVRIESFSLVLDSQKNSLSSFAATVNFNQCLSVLFNAVNKGIASTFPKCRFDSELIALNAARSFDHSHQLIHERRDRFDFARHPSVDGHRGGTRVYANACWWWCLSRIHRACSIHEGPPDQLRASQWL